jgi:hypothetical protein
MDFVDIIVLVLLFAAAIAAYVIYAIRGGRIAREPGSPRLTRVKLNPVPRVTPAAPTVSEPTVARAASAAAPPAAVFDLDSEALSPTPPSEICWCRQFDPRSEALDDTARLRLIGDLGVVAKEWCVPLLAQAYQEEQRPSHRQAALTSLAACHSRAAAGTFRAALAAGDTAERAIASDGLADLEPAQQAKIRRTVDRF